MASGPPIDLIALKGAGDRNKKVAYFYDSDVGNYAYVSGHPMKPHRIRMTHSLVMNYGLYKKMEIYVSLISSYASQCSFNWVVFRRCLPVFFSARKTRIQIRDDAVPHRRIYRLSV